MCALVKIKEEPVDQSSTWSRIAQFSEDGPRVADIERLATVGRRAPGILTPSTRARIRAETTANAGSSGSSGNKRKSKQAEADVPEDYGVPDDEIHNSDEDQSRRARRAEYAKATQAAAKRARRKLDPPDEWKDMLDAERQDNMQLDDTDCLRKHATVAFIEPMTGVVEVDENRIVSVSEMDAAQARTRSGLPLVFQDRVTPAPPVLRSEIRKRLEELKEDPNAEGRIVPVYAVNAPMRHTTRADAETLAMARIPPEKDSKKKPTTIVVPPQFDLSELSMDEIMLHTRTDQQGQVLAQTFMWSAATCNYADLNFITQELKQRGVYNCPLSRIGPMDDYYAMMTPNYRKVDEDLMREPLRMERPCIEDEMCVGRQIPNSQPITLVEYIDVADMQYFSREHKWRGERKHCVLCRRALATKAGFSMLAECAAFSDTMASSVRVSREGAYESARLPLMLVNFYHFVGENEYSPYDVLISNVNRFIGMAAPVAIFIASRFTQYKKDGVLYFKQDYPCPKRNLGEWGTLVSSELSQATRPRPQSSTPRRPRRPTDYSIPRPLL